MTLKRLATAVLTAASILSFSAPALAGGGGGWTDISYLLNERQNRPVWAMAYASPYWYLTDGQDLWSGGHVWKTEGSSMSDITLEVRNAGLSRVDEILSDGQNLMFISGTALQSEQFNIVYFNGSYTDVTSYFRSTFASNEGLHAIHGYQGTWMISSTRGNLYKWTPVNNYPQQISKPTGINYNYSYDLPSYVNRSGVMLEMLPIAGGQWLLVGRNQSGSSISYGYYKYNNGSFTDVTSYIDPTPQSYYYINVFASNGSTVLMVKSNPSTSPVYLRAGTYDGSNFTQLSAVNPMDWAPKLVGNDTAIWTGQAWEIIANKKWNIEAKGNSIYSNGETKDYLITAAGNSNGIVLFGGAVSELGNYNPTNPLTAKLVRYDANGTNSTNNSGTFGGGRTYTSSYGPSVTTAGNPSDYRVGNGGTFIYRATASDANGVDRIDLYVNGARLKTCYAETCDYENIYYTNGLSTRAIPLYVRATDKLGYTTETAQETMTVDNSSATAGTGGSSNQTTVNGTSYWTWLEPNQSSLHRDQTMSYSVGAWNADGLKRMEIYVNGGLRRTCDYNRAYGNQTCSYTLYGYDYPLNTNVATNAKITDWNDKVVWTPLQNIYITDVSGSSDNATGDVSISNWMDPSGSTLNRGSSTVLRVQANATQGLNRVEVYADGTLKRTCDFSRVYGNQNCDLTINANDYSIAQHSFSARATDYNGKTAWSDTRTLTIQDNGSNSNGNLTVSNWFDSSVTTLNRNSNVNLNVQASAKQGLNSITVYADGNVIRTCNYSRVYGTQDCDITIYGNNYSVGQHNFNAKAVDYNGNASWSDTRNLTIQDSATNSNSNTTITSKFYPEVTVLDRTSYVNLYASASDSDGLSKVEIYADGNLKRTCNYYDKTSGDCLLTIYGGDYLLGAHTFSAKATDNFNNVAWSNTLNLTIQDTTGNSTKGGEVSTWVWSDPEVTTVNAGQSATFHVGAWALNGIRKIEILANGGVVKTCDFGGVVYGNRECSVNVATTYGGTTNATYYARATDGNWGTFSSQSKSYTIDNTTGSIEQHPSDQPSSINASSNRDGGYGYWDKINFSASGSDADGIAKIEILVNAKLVKTCSDASSCSVSGGSYGNRKSVTYGARLIDKLGNSVFTGYKTLYKK